MLTQPSSGKARSFPRAGADPEHRDRMGSRLMHGALVVVSRDQAERGLFGEPDQRNQIMAVQALPENDDVIGHMFGDLVVRGTGGDPYDWRILEHLHEGWYPPAFKYGAYRGSSQQDVQRGDWFILYVGGLIHHYAPATFESDFVVTGPAAEPRVSEALDPDHLPPKSEWQKPHIDNLPPRSEWPKRYWKENG